MKFHNVKGNILSCVYHKFLNENNTVKKDVLIIFQQSNKICNLRVNYN